MTQIRLGQSVRHVFFGWRSELEKFAVVAEIVIPDIVIDEIKAQKRAHLESKRDQFIDNPFHEIKKLNRKESDDFNIEKYVDDLQKGETIDHTIIYLSQKDALSKIKQLCHRREAPFGDVGDKGFKDAYIYLTVLEYLEGITNEQVFFVTGDGKLKEAMERVRGIRVIKNFRRF